MSVRTASEQMAGPIGRELAMSDDETQATFLNEFARGLHVGCNGRPDTQLCYIAGRLDPTAMKVLEQLAGFIELEREVRP